MDATNAKRALLARSRAALGGIEQIGTVTRAMALATDPEDIAALRDQLTELESELEGQISALSARLDAQPAGRCSWRFTIERDQYGQIAEVLVDPLQ
jgi:hypothetical protein